MFKFSNNNFIKFGFIIFNIGIFLLASAPFLSIIFILLSIIISPLCHKDYKWLNSQGIILILLGFIFVVNTLVLSLFDNTPLVGEEKIKLFIDLFNWIPFFVCFFLFQPYLKNPAQKKITALLLLVGTLPVIITGIGQYYFGWEETLTAINGNIIWFLKPIDDVKGLSGLFSNPNYAGSWLGIILPFSIAFLFSSKKINVKKFINLIYFILIFISIILTNSKDTLIALILPFPIILKTQILKNKNLLITLISVLIILVTNIIYSLIKNDFNLIYFIDIFPRIDIWRVSLTAILEKPIFGWGATTFPFIYRNYRYEFINDSINHAHNLFFEISINYGLISSILISIFILYILINSFKKILNDNNLINKAWWAATLSFLINNFLM